MSLQQRYIEAGAVIASDGIPNHFGDVATEYHTALDGAILLDRSHEARLELNGQDRFELLNRMSTNQIIGLNPQQGVPTIFTNANARILDRVEVFNWQDQSLLMLGGPGRGNAIFSYLQQNIFFNDQVVLNNLDASTALFALHGTQADAVIQSMVPQAQSMDLYAGTSALIAEKNVYVARLKPLAGSHWIIMPAIDDAEIVWQAIMDAGKTFGLRPSGGLVYNVLRIRAGVPGVGRELSNEYIPLEVGLWDEISFSKGCYTGQEIIARMESRNKLARTMVSLSLDQYVDAPTELFYEGKRAGHVTSSVVSPNGDIFAIGVVKTAVAHDNQLLFVGHPEGTHAVVQKRLGVQPAHLFE